MTTSTGTGPATAGIAKSGELMGRAAMLALLALVLVIGVAPHFLFADADWVGGWANGFWALVVAATALKCLGTTRRLHGHERKGWLCISMAFVAYFVSQVIWSVYELILKVPNPIATAADVGYFACPLLLMIGIWLYRTAEPTPGMMLIQLGNFGIIVASILLAHLILFFELIRTSSPSARNPVLLAYVVIATSAFVFAMFNVWFYLRGRRRLVMTPLLLALGALAVTDYVATFGLISGEYSSASLSNWGYLLVYSLAYWAAFEQDQLQGAAAHDARLEEVEGRGRQWETLLPPISVVAVLALALDQRENLNADLTPYAAGALLLFVTSLAVRDWWSHRVEVELREQSRSSEVQLQDSEARLLQKNEELANANRELWDEMKARIRIQEELRQSQKMEALGQLTGGVAHDFNNLLAVVLGNLELLTQRLDPDSQESALASEATGAAERGAALTQRLLVFSRKQKLRPRPVDVRTLLEGMRGMLESTLSEAIRVEMRVAEDLWHCMADPAQLENAILNVSINSRDAMSGGGRLVIEASNLTLGEAGAAEHAEALPGRYVAISLRDSGAGIPDEILSKVFNPFFTTKEIGAGSGLGLSMVYGFAKQSAGYVSIHSEVDLGTEVRICLPRAEAPDTSGATADADTTPRGNGESVLLVEDEPTVRRLVVTILEDLGYEVIQAGDGSEALAILHDDDSVDLLLSDAVLPGVYSGPDLVREVLRRRPGVKALLISGYARQALEQNGSALEDLELLQKPFKKDELARCVRSVLERD